MAANPKLEKWQAIAMMDKLAHYRTCIQTLLEQHSQSKTQDDEVEDELVFDLDGITINSCASVGRA